MKNLKSVTNLDGGNFYIKWRMTDRCNLSCSYCIANALLGIEKPTKAYLEERQKRLEEVAERINLLAEKTEKNICIDLIGGEVTLFDLKSICSHFTAENLYKIQITTNFIRPAEYYIALAELLSSRNIIFSVTASFHSEFTDIDAYFEKVGQVSALPRYFCCEMVSLPHNQDLVRDFRARCEALGIDYMIEGDVRKDHDRTAEVIVCSKKAKGNRYEVVLTDGEVRQYTTRNMFLKEKDIEEVVDGKGIHTEGFSCTISWNYITIDFDMVQGRTADDKHCTNQIVIEDFRPVEPCACISKNNYCTLCGHMNLEKLD